MNNTSVKSGRRQTAFRLDKELLFFLGRKAKREGKSLNGFVEDVLRKEVADELEWPRIKGPVVISDEVERMSPGISFTPEEIASDDRLSYILSK